MPIAKRKIETGKRKPAKKPAVLRAAKKQVNAASSRARSTKAAQPVPVRVISVTRASVPLREKTVWSIKRFARRMLPKLFYGTALTMLTLLIVLPFFNAFEAHIINVSATPIQIDPPILTPPGPGTPWYDSTGGINLTGTVNVFLSDPDADATHIYFTYATGTNPTLVPDPICGQTGPNGGGGDKIPIELVALSLTSDTVIKAIGCDGSTGSAHKSVVNTKIYDFQEPLCPSTSVSFPTNLAVLSAGNNTTTDAVLMGASSVVNGDARSNQDIVGSPTPTNPTINGNATTVGNISPQPPGAGNRLNITGTRTTGAAATTLPNIQIPTWKSNAALGGIVNGSFVFPNSTSGISIGPTEIMGNVTFGTSNSATIDGPIYIHGNLTIGAGTTIIQGANFSGKFVTIIVDGIITIGANVSFVGAGGVGTILLVSTAAAQTGSGAAILATSTSATNLGRALLYASNGDIHISPSRTVLSAFATHGTSAADPAIRLDSGVNVIYQMLPTEIACGPVYTPANQVVINEFVPNLPDVLETAPITLTPNGIGNFNNWNVVPATSTKQSAVATNDADTSYIGTPGSNNTDQTFTFPGAGIPAGATITSVTLNAIARDPSGGGQKISLKVEKGIGGTNESNGSTVTLTGSYVTYSRLMTTNPFTGVAWTLAEVNAWTSRFGVRTENNPGTGRVTQITLVVNYTPPPNNGDIGAPGLPHDGEWVELYNGTGAAVNVNGWALYDANNTHELIITATNSSGSLIIAPGGFLVVYRDGDADFDLDDTADTIRLYNAPIGGGGVLQDSHTYNYGSTIPFNKSFSRVPDGTSNWVDPDPTPGAPNTEFFIAGDIAEPLPVAEEIPPEQVLDDSIGDSASSTDESLATTTEDTLASSTPDSTADATSTPDSEATTTADSNLPPAGTSDTSTPPQDQPAPSEPPAPDVILPTNQDQQQAAPPPPEPAPTDNPPPPPPVDAVVPPADSPPAAG